MLVPSKDKAKVDPMRNIFLLSLHFCGDDVVDRVASTLELPYVENCGMFEGCRRTGVVFPDDVAEYFLR